MEEAIESFLRQTYLGPKELIVLNDNPKVRYAFDHPEVKVVNLDERYKSLGMKLNLGTVHCRYNYRVNWPDDDIFLPHALDTIAAGMHEADYYTFDGSWQIDKNDKITWTDDTVYGIIPINIEYFRLVGGYPENMSCGADKALRQKLETFGIKKSHKKITPEQGFFIRRWSPNHLSGYTEERAWETIGAIGMKMPAREWKLKPHWNDDYENCTRGIV